MRTYSGNTSFQYEIERMKHKETETYYPMDNDPSTTDNSHEYEYTTITLEVEGESFYSRGRSYGAPEDCYPDEGETSIIEITGPGKLNWEELLTNSERSNILSEIEQRVQEDGE